ncbi:MAG: hypothetical protein L0Y80_12040 [Ignavibacteriae bacterium]|nr:hypothetical protein [Ignavibacteriota bacterium]
MDSQKFQGKKSPMFAFFDRNGLRDWFLGTGGNARWRFLVLVWDFWHICKNLMWIAVGVGAYFIAASGIQSWLWIVVVPVVIGMSFIFMFHRILKAPFN